MQKKKTKQFKTFKVYTSRVNFWIEGRTVSGLKKNQGATNKISNRNPQVRRDELMRLIGGGGS